MIRKYIICESKYSKKGDAGLSKDKTKDGLQMSRKWIRKNLEDSVSIEVFEDIMKVYTDSNNNKIRNFNSVLFKIDEKGNVKYSELSYDKAPQELKNNFQI